MLLEDPRANDQGISLGWQGRLASAVRRRARRVWRSVAPGACHWPIESALEWLLSRTTPGGICDAAGLPDPVLSRACLPTLTILGQRSLLARWSPWLREAELQTVQDAAAPAGEEWESPVAEFARQTVRDYLCGDRAAGDRGWSRLVRLQKPSGGIPLSWHGAGWRRESVLATKYFLDAAVLQARLAFERGAGTLPSEIAEDDGRLGAVISGMAPLASGPAHVADIGCGSGRFLKRLAGQFPAMTWTGIDPSPAMLEQLPEGMGRRSGGLPSIPADDGAFDGVLAVEALEHSLVPEAAVAELCRVVRPGGRVVIIDKHSAWQPLSECEPWERWFEPHEVLSWLGAHCDRVAAWPVGHGAQQSPSGLFWCWSGRRG